MFPVRRNNEQGRGLRSALWVLLMTMVCFAADPTAPVQLKQASKVNSIWAVTFDVPDSAPDPKNDKFPDQPQKLFLIKTSSRDVAVIDAPSANAVKGTVTGSHLTFTLGNEKQASLNGLGADLRDSTTGTMSVLDGGVHWKAVKLGAVWICGNHFPKYHAATTPDEIRFDTKEFKCEKWHMLKAD